MSGRRKLRVPFKLLELENVLQDDMLQALGEAADRVATSETLALVLIEIQRGGDIVHHTHGEEDGFRHALVAGATYVINDLSGAILPEDDRG